MSDPIYIAIVAEGPTDRVVIEAALDSILAGRSYVAVQLQPEQSAAFGGPVHFGLLGGGWGGVYKWCRQAQDRAGGKLSDDPIFLRYNILIIHLDADVAGKKYADISVSGEPGQDLPCEQPCPPPDASTAPLRRVVLGWAGATDPPPQLILCTPSKSMEAWVLKALVPNEKDLTKKGWECHPFPEGRLATLPKKIRFTKREEDYKQRREEITSAWPSVALALSEAQRFDRDLRRLLP